MPNSHSSNTCTKAQVGVAHRQQQRRSTVARVCAWERTESFPILPLWPGGWKKGVSTHPSSFSCFSLSLSPGVLLGLSFYHVSPQSPLAPSLTWQTSPPPLISGPLLQTRDAQIWFCNNGQTVLEGNPFWELQTAEVNFWLFVMWNQTKKTSIHDSCWFPLRHFTSVSSSHLRININSEFTKSSLILYMTI